MTPPGQQPPPSTPHLPTPSSASQSPRPRPPNPARPCGTKRSGSLPGRGATRAAGSTLAPPQARRTKHRTSGRPVKLAPARARCPLRLGAPSHTHRAATAAACATGTSARRPGAGLALGLCEGRAPRRPALMQGLSRDDPVSAAALAWPASPQPALPAEAAQPPTADLTSAWSAPWRERTGT